MVYEMRAVRFFACFTPYLESRTVIVCAVPITIPAFGRLPPSLYIPTLSTSFLPYSPPLPLPPSIQV
jgi:hypothetical protein